MEISSAGNPTRRRGVRCGQAHEDERRFLRPRFRGQIEEEEKAARVALYATRQYAKNARDQIRASWPEAIAIPWRSLPRFYSFLHMAGQAIRKHP